MRVVIAGQGVSFVLGDEWRVDPPWDEPSVQREQGMYVRHLSLGVELHLRGWSQGSPDREGMQAQLAGQNWPPPALHGDTRTENGISWAAATWQAPPWVVREWFLTDGRGIANAVLVGTSLALVDAATDSANRLLLSVRF